MQILSKKALLFGFLLIGLLGQPAFAKANPFFGNWQNVDPKTKGIVRAVIDAGAPEGITLYGACHPTPCNWGKVKFTISGEGTEGRSQIGKAHYTQSHAEIDVVAKVLSNGNLQLATSTKFTDSSHRKDLSKTEILQRAAEDESP